MDSDGGNRVRVRDRQVVKEREGDRIRVSHKRSPERRDVINEKKWGIEIGDDKKSGERVKEKVGDKYSEVRDRVRTSVREREKDRYPVKSGVKDEDMVEAIKRDRERERKRRERERREDLEVELDRERKRIKRKNEMEKRDHVIQEEKRGRGCAYGYHYIEILDDTKSRDRVKEKVGYYKYSDVRCREKYRNRYRASRRFNDGATRQKEKEATRQKEKNKSKTESEEKERRNRERKKTEQQEREDRERERRQRGERKNRMIREQHEIEEEREREKKEKDDRMRENDRKENEREKSISEDISSPIGHPLFRKNFYVEANEISEMSSVEVSTYRKQLRLTFLRGNNILKPIYTWQQSGLSTTILDTLKTLNFEKPMPIQAQALPLIMSGRDCIGVAKTGSGKTLAFILPMLMHIKDQSPLVSGDGPIGLVMAPTTELVQQIHSDISKFIKPFGLTCVPFCGGKQIDELNRGAEIVVCTPDRMMDLLSSSDGKITDLRRVTYLVMDETDWMLDMGFGSQITRIVRETHPDRQTVLFSATFDRGVELFARKVFFINPVEIQIGYPSIVDEGVTQLVEVRPVDQRFLRLLELLGEWYEKGKILISVDSQDKCTKLLKDLLHHGYPCLSLQDQEQTDRKSIVSDFKSNVCKLLVVTSTAARGLGVKELKLVINYAVPNQFVHYVHLVDLAGRADRKGCAITFISEDEAGYALGLELALKRSNQLVPDELKALVDGLVRAITMTNVEKEQEARKAMKKAQAKEYVFEEDKSHSENENVGVRKNLVKIEEDAMAEHYEDELEINQCPENARCWVTDKKIVGPITKWTGATITIRGQYYPPGKIAGPLDRKLYLFIEGPTENSVTTTKLRLMYALQDFMLGLLRPNC